VIFIDIESYYDVEYTLKKVPTWAYIFDPRFELFGVGYAVDDKPAAWVDACDVPELAKELQALPGEQTMVSHNTVFDGTVLYQRHGYMPARYGDTLSMARVVIGDGSDKLDLDTCCGFMGIQGKRGAEVMADTKGKHWADFTPEQRRLMAEYCIGDVDACRDLYHALRPYVPANQDWHIHWATKNFVVPMFQLDVGTLEEVSDSRDALEALIVKGTGIELPVFRSRDKFAALMADKGYPVPVKTSKTTGRLIPALSKTDFEFSEYMTTLPANLLLLCKTFQAAISNTNHTRARRYLSVANVTQDKWWPVHLNHSGAKQTHRMSGGGGGGGNPQNLVRGGKLRRAILPPPGYVVVAPDLNAIELRISMQLCGVVSVLEAFARDGDPYSEYVAHQAGIDVSQVDSDMRMLGKVKMLALQYGVGWKTYGLQAWVRTGNPISRNQAEIDVAYYRRTIWQVPVMWKALTNIIKQMHLGLPSTLASASFLDFQPEAIFLPSGLALKYRDIKKGPGGYTCLSVKPQLKRARYRKKLYGGLLLENLAQAIAGEVVREKRQLLAENLYWPGLEVHDELVGVVPRAQALRVKEEAERLLSLPVSWWPELPIKAECGVGDTYGEAK
jgi:DNA polymerase